MTLYFVDLNPHPALRITRRAVPSCADEIRRMDGSDRTRRVEMMLPDDTESRFWVRADSPGEALCKAQDRALEARAAG